MARKTYIYKKASTLGNIQSISGRNNFLKYTPMGAYNIQSRPYTHPYTPLVPLYYVLSCGDPVHRTDLSRTILRSMFPIGDRDGERMRERILTGFIRRASAVNSRCVHRETLKLIRGWLLHDRCISISSQLYESTRFGTSREIIMNNIDYSEFFRFSMRSYSGATSPLSLYKQNNDATYTPYIIAVVLPENVIPVKLHLLAYNTIPLDRVIVLVDRKLFTTTFHHPAFKSLCRQMYADVVEKTCCDVWHVPHEFIMENCFEQPYTLKSESIRERREEVGALINRFIKSGLTEEAGIIPAPPREWVGESGYLSDLTLEDLSVAVDQMYSSTTIFHSDGSSIVQIPSNTFTTLTAEGISSEVRYDAEVDVGF